VLALLLGLVVAETVVAERAFDLVLASRGRTDLADRFELFVQGMNRFGGHAVVYTGPWAIVNIFLFESAKKIKDFS